jgi:hypothetical protein
MIIIETSGLGFAARRGLDGVGWMTEVVGE